MVNQISFTEKAFGNSTAKLIIRYSVYTFGILLLMFSLPWLAKNYGAVGFRESGLIEWAQLSLIISMCLLFLRESFVTRELREIFIIFACFLAFVSFRELDSYLDRVSWATWKYA